MYFWRRRCLNLSYIQTLSDASEADDILKTLWQKEKRLITGKFAVCHNVFNTIYSLHFHIKRVFIMLSKCKVVGLRFVVQSNLRLRTNFGKKTIWSLFTGGLNLKGHSCKQWVIWTFIVWLLKTVYCYTKMVLRTGLTVCLKGLALSHIHQICSRRLWKHCDKNLKNVLKSRSIVK